MKNTHYQVIAFAAVVTLLAYGILSNFSIISNLRKAENTLAAGCGQNAGFFTLNCPNGQNFQTGTLASNTQIYTTDDRFKFDNIPTALANATYIQTPNKEIKDNTTLNWSITLSQPATIYVMPRHIPWLNPPAWITDSFTPQTDDNMSNTTQYVTRKNPSGAIGEYDLYTKDVDSGTVTFNGAADAQNEAYSMYLVAVVKRDSSQTPVPTSQLTNPPTSAPTNTAAPTTHATTTAAPTQPSETIVPGPPGSQKGYIVTNDELRQRKALADQGQEPYKSALGPVLSYASSMLGKSPSPQNPLNIPGTTGPFVDDSNAANALGIAYGLTGDNRYAAKARDFIMAWVNTTKSTSNTCPDSGGCQTSLIIGRMAPGYVFAADLIKPSGVFSTSDDAAFKSWLRTVILPTASVRNNNWGDAGLQMRIIVADYIGDQAALSSGIAKYKSQVDLVASDGHIPEETRRGSGGITYSSGAIGFRVAAAKVMERRGMDLWSYGRMKLSADYLSKYILNPGSWPWSSGAGTNTHNWWELAYAKWREPGYVPVVKSKRPYGAVENTPLEFSTMTNGVPLP